MAKKIFFGSETLLNLQLLLVIIFTKLSNVFVTAAPEIDHDLFYGIILIVARSDKLTDIVLYF